MTCPRPLTRTSSAANHIRRPHSLILADQPDTMRDYLSPESPFGICFRTWPVISCLVTLRVSRITRWLQRASRVPMRCLGSLLECLANEWKTVWTPQKPFQTLNEHQPLLPVVCIQALPALMIGALTQFTGLRLYRGANLPQKQSCSSTA